MTRGGLDGLGTGGDRAATLEGATVAQAPANALMLRELLAEAGVAVAEALGPA